MSGSVSLEISAGIARLVLDRPEKRNALNANMVRDLVVRCHEIELSDAKVVILSGAGEAFCAGGDIEDWSAASADEFGRHWVREGHIAFDALARLRQPVIAVLDGHALGGGLELAVCADYRLGEEHIKIGQPETGLGIIPGWSGTQRAVRRFGAQAVRRMAVLGEVFTASEAQSLGILDQVVPKGQALIAANELAQNVLSRSGRATELAKMMVNAAEGEERERVIEAMAGTIAAGSEDLQIGLDAFRNKRKPDFGGKR